VFEREAHLKALMIGGLDGDAAAWRALLTELRAPLGAFFRRRMGDRVEVEDLIQETLIAVHAKRATYDPALPFTAWVHAVARHKMIDGARREARRPTAPLEAAGDPAGDHTVEDGATRRDLSRVLALLPARQRRLIEDVRVHGFSMAEAAERHGMTEGAVKVSVHRGLKALMERVSPRS
jgi:RNA polymerase sigma-70 factor, ECF subfamily